jgi:hypothetical protein
VEVGLITMSTATSYCSYNYSPSMYISCCTLPTCLPADVRRNKREWETIVLVTGSKEHVRIRGQFHFDILGKKESKDYSVCISNWKNRFCL